MKRKKLHSQEAADAHNLGLLKLTLRAMAVTFKDVVISDAILTSSLRDFVDSFKLKRHYPDDASLLRLWQDVKENEPPPLKVDRALIEKAKLSGITIVSDGEEADPASN
jgi:hypothetical protein